MSLPSSIGASSLAFNSHDMYTKTQWKTHKTNLPPTDLDEKVSGKEVKTQQGRQVTVLREYQPQPSSSGEQRVLAARHLCPKCPKTFGSFGKLSQHIMYSFACQFCPKAFSSKVKLVRHMLIHSDLRQYTCQICERTFHRKDHLKSHAKVHDPMKSIYTCNRPGCGKQYSSLLYLRKHTALHAAENANLECTICGQKFASKEEIVFHAKVHAGSRTVKTAEDCKYHCDHCDQSFFTGKDAAVRRHMVVHTGKRDFLCQFCPHLRTVDAHQFDQPAASSSSSPSYSAMLDSFGLELKPGDLEDLKDLKPEDIAPMPLDSFWRMMRPATTLVGISSA
ncbi:zinc finger protein PLAG1-like [Nilaparvata lugens]|uniref:zinc finger protein PLAG1-like n=1 Tax=Nilaparvata lugens TaxID=108931 RepID=UPI00193EA09E|nr:zinc finger protein PLAG1-like [Nilaparvata lugens]